MIRLRFDRKSLIFKLLLFFYGSFSMMEIDFNSVNISIDFDRYFRWQIRKLSGYNLVAISIGKNVSRSEMYQENLSREKTTNPKNNLETQSSSLFITRINKRSTKNPRKSISNFLLI